MEVGLEERQIGCRRPSRESGVSRDHRPADRAAARVALQAAIGLLTLALAAELGYHFLVAPRVLLERIELTGDAVLSEAEVAEIAGLERGVSLLAVSPDRVRALLEAAPAVRQAEVRRQLPDTLAVRLEGRRALAVALVASGGTTIPLAIDEEGLVFASGPRAAADNVPVISGLTFSRWEPGTRLPALLRPLLEDLGRLRSEEPALYSFISEVAVTRAGEGSLELLVYPATCATPVRAGGRLTPELLKNAVLFLDVVRREKLEDRVREVDLRSREVVYTERSGR